MTVPIAYYLFRTSDDIRVRVLAAGIAALSIIAVIGSPSRGGLISLGVLVLGLLMRTKNKLLSTIILLAVVGLTLSMMPGEWFDRMHTISNAGELGSFMGRVEAWDVAYKLGHKYPLLGLGSRLQYYPEYNSLVGAPYVMRATHNAYLEILAGNGLLAFAAFIGMMGAAFFRCAKIRKLSSNKIGLQWANDLAGILQLSLAVYGVGVIALSMELWTGLWLNMALVLTLHEIVLKDIKSAKVPGVRESYA
ncbi:MAG: hypothetical protein EXR08_08510 [Alphaproteobacteria bacterium]|nr:hypothetical protein [Alphaproteobacteria bacterium]